MLTLHYNSDMPKKSISDTLAKSQCGKYLARLGYENLQPAVGRDCDLIGYKNGSLYYFEIKYSSKIGGDFFGCVMFTQLFRAVSNKERYFFVVCRGDKENLDNWFYKIFTVEEFLGFCTLTTPICHYRMVLDGRGGVKKANIGKKSVVATEEMILDIWKKFRQWKPEQPRTPLQC
jgi:hypothetical protein